MEPNHRREKKEPFISVIILKYKGSLVSRPLRVWLSNFHSTNNIEVIVVQQNLCDIDE